MNQDCSSKDPIAIFDSLYTNDSIQILKVMYDLLPSNIRRKLAILIKMRELQYTIDLANNIFPADEPGAINDNSSNDLSHLGDMLNQVQPYFTEENQKLITNLCGMFNMMKTYEKMQESITDFEQKTGISISQLMNAETSPEELLASLMSDSSL